MAIKKTIEIDVDVVRANGGLENFTQNFEKTEKAAKSLRTQLKEAQADVANLSEKFGATSKEAVEAAKRAGELKDQIGDAKALTDAFNPDAKFKAVSASLSGVASGFAAYQGALGLAGVESKELEKQLLKVQSAMALAQGLQGLGEARDSFKQLKAVAIDAFKGIKTAIGSTGIGLLVIALGTIYAYWDDIKEAVSGVSEEQKKLNADSKKNLDQENEKLKTIDAQDNILKLQGKSEKEILAIKIKQTDEAIQATEINNKNQIQTNKLAVEGAQRNYELLKSFIDFVSIPQRFLYETASKAINNIIDLLNKIPGVNIKAKLDETLGDKAVDYLAKLGFDPDKVKADGEKSAKEANEALIKLKNDRAGYQLSIKDIDKKAAEDAILTDEEKKKKLKELSDQYNKTLAEEEPITPDTTDLQLAQDKLNAAAKFKEDQIAAEEAFQLKITQLQYDSQTERDARDEEARQKKIQSFQETTEAIGSIAQSGEELLAAVQAAGLAKGKAAQGAMKALALVQIGADSAIAFSKMMQGTEQSAAGAASGAPGPAAPAVYLATKIAFYASGTATILANIARAKKLLSGGGGGGASGVASAGAGGGGGSAAPPPQFNIVGQSSTNQLSQTIAGQQNRPIQTYVVGNQVSTQQSLDRNAVATSTFG
tara:strand:+ start:103 stop:2067 length:1965 start_codon:yes stop_codon:yes gene_type:complete